MSATQTNYDNRMTGDQRSASEGCFCLIRVSSFVMLLLSAILHLLSNPRAHAQLVADGATNTLANVTNIISGGVTVGTNGSFSLLVMANNCLLTNSGLSEIGRNSTARSNEVRLVSPTARWHMLNPLNVGVSGSFNRLAISNGASVQSSQGVIGNFPSSASNNTVIVNGSGSTWSVASSFIVGLVGGGNRFEVSDGGRVTSESGWIGEAASNNLAVVTGNGSVWSNATDLTIGNSRSSNRLVVSNAGSVFANGTVLLGNLVASSNNQLTVNGGTLRVTNASATGTLNVRRGTATLEVGLMEVDRLLVTNTAGRFEFNGGTLSTRSTSVNNGQSFRVGNGVNPATLLLAGDGTHSFANGLTISANAAFTGSGTIGGVPVVINGTLSPGASIGILRFSSPPSFSGTTLMEISKNGTMLTNDQIVVTGTTTYFGVLTVSNIGPDALAAGDRVLLFGGGAYAGNFVNILLPPLGIGLAWTNKLLVDGSIEVINAPIFADSFVGLARAFSTSAWVDYDNDERLDIGVGTRIYRNLGDGFTSLVSGVETESVSAWNDYNNDARLDLFSGNSVLRNTATGLTNIQAGLPFGEGGAWGDYDNDGRPDILLHGPATNGPRSEVWRNTSKEFTNLIAGLTAEFTDIHTMVTGVVHGAAAWSDYDKDGRLDIALTGGFGLGSPYFAAPFAEVFRNTGSGFMSINTGLSPVVYSSVAWGDYDNDGWLDILMTGMTNVGPSAPLDQFPTTQVWRNTGVGFTNINAGLPGVFRGSATWGDYDNDGRLDILLAGGTTGIFSDFAAPVATNLICQIWRNTGSGFTNINAGLPGIADGTAAWGDYDNDGRLDILLTGTIDNQPRSIAAVWRNHTPLTNTPPTAPTGLSVTNVGDRMTFSWNAASDAQTPASGLTYNVRIGTTPGGSDAMSPMSSSSGWRRLPQMGNAQNRLFAIFHAQLNTPYYWSVQAVDTDFAGGPFAPEQSFTINSVFTPTNGIPVPGDQNGDGMVSQFELAAVLANLNGNGVLSEADLNLVLSNYFPNSPFLQMTNVAGLGGTNVTFALTNSLAGAFSVEYTTNLVDWYFLGPATPRYLFTDTNAPAEPLRYYRLRWP